MISAWVPLILGLVFGAFFAHLALAAPPESPRLLDDDLAIDLFAFEPEIVTPVAIDVDRRGRVWVIESHTHETPRDYRGPSSDRILVFEDLDRDGRADRRTRFAEGFRHSMSLEVRPDGSVWLATRRALHRLVDTDGDGLADERSVVARLETTGDYPHNGLSGFAFDELGHVYFGIGENLGVHWRLVALDGSSLEGGTEGGDVFRMCVDGTRLERFATGFWNPFHLELDALGRLWAVDNDPDARPPCRLIHVTRGGDYGYRFWLGRAGLHPFTSWNGQLPGTLPMTAGTGEAPSAIVAYEHDELPERYRGALFVTSWGDHRIEVYRPEADGASFRATAEPIVQGGEDFRPVGIALAPDGSIFFSDWVDRSYPVHGRGRIWRLRAKESRARETFADAWAHPRRAARLDRADAWLESRSEESARALLDEAFSSDGLAVGAFERMRAIARAGAPARGMLLGRLFGRRDALAPEIEAAALRVVASFPSAELDAFGIEIARVAFARETPAVVRLEALTLLSTLSSFPRRDEYLDELLELAASAGDAFIESAAIHAMAMLVEPDELAVRTMGSDDSRERLAILVALRRVGGMGRGFVPFGDRRDVPLDVVRSFLADPDPAIRRAAIQWVGEESLAELRDELERAAERDPDGTLSDAWIAAVELLEGRKPNDLDRQSRAERLWKIVTRQSAPGPARLHALRALDPTWTGIDASSLKSLIDDPNLAIAAIRTIRAARADFVDAMLVEVVDSRERPTAMRREALIGLAGFPERREHIRKALFDADAVVAREAARILREVKLSPTEAERRERLLAQTVDAPERGTASWREWVLSGGDSEEGEVLFFHPAGPRCSACHTVNGRGGRAGPDLSRIGERAGDAILDAILDPSRDIARGFDTWVAATRDSIVSGVRLGEDAEGRVLIGTAEGEVRPLDAGKLERLERQEGSIMPAGLEATMSDAELRDLVAFLRG
ncbi:MAG TPA: PVC-type heme-binding CxxCH protein, partial [Planctomycetota bacterium]|nr:PVC-type heme-binding CxxCH protein [Planctomycetota bacterium]